MKKITFLVICGLLSTFLVFPTQPAFACDYSRGTITSVSPQTISAGDILTITGTGFGTLGSGQNEVHFIFFEPPSTTRHGGGSFGGGFNGGTENYISWSNTEIQIRIPTDFETRYGGVMNALNQDINKFHPYVIIYDDSGKEVCGSPIDGANSTFYYQPSCSADEWTCDDWDQCSVNNQQTRSCTKTLSCPLVDTPLSLPTQQSCTYVPPICTSWDYSNWSSCSESGQKTRSVTSSSPANCTGGSPVLNQSCTYVAPACTSWTYSDWSSCSTNGQKTRSVLTSSPSSCNGGSPVLTQSCTYTTPAPTCTADTWVCEEWNSCSPSGIQSRSCTKTFDCPSTQTASPATDQFCSAPKPPQTAPSQSDEISNQDIIVKSTVKLLCPVDEYSASQGSGTVIDSSGTILTNKHVVAGTLGCLVGFIDDFGDEPYFGGRQIADIVKTSSTQDVAILKIRNPNNTKLSYVDIADGSSNISLGTKITTYGYPAQFGTKITYTSGDFSGEDGSYLKTTAILEYGNSGGGAYLKNGTFIGIPSAVVKGELNALGYILSINTINAWLGNGYVAYDDSNNNQYSRVSVLEDIDLNELDALELFIPKTDEEGNITTPAQSNYFPDVPETHPNAIAIEVLRERNIINGYPDGTFKPENTVNRAELLKILVEGKIGKPDENEYKNCFPDVTTQWFAPYICYAKAEGWVQGYSDGKFKPEQTVNKVEALKMLINSQEIATTETITSKPFDDVKITDWFIKYVAKAKEMAILEETGSTFSPGEGMKRAGISENLYRLLIQ